MTRRRFAAAALTATTLLLTASLAACSRDAAPTPNVSVTPTEASQPTDAPTITDKQPTTVPQPSGSASPGQSDTDPTTPSGESTATVEGLGKAAPDATRVASRYLSARENAESGYQKTSTSWLDEIKPTMTAKAFAALRRDIGNEGGDTYAWQESHDKGLKVKVVVACGVNEAAGDNKNTVVLLCTLTDQVVYRSGTPVPINSIPDTWPYVGPQESPQLGMVRQNGKWLVDHDYTGEAS